MLWQVVSEVEVVVEQARARMGPGEILRQALVWCALAGVGHGCWRAWLDDEG
jgi:hypothetical protein